MNDVWNSFKVMTTSPDHVTWKLWIIFVVDLRFMLASSIKPYKTLTWLQCLLIPKYCACTDYTQEKISHWLKGGFVNNFHVPLKSNHNLQQIQCENVMKLKIVQLYEIYYHFGQTLYCKEIISIHDFHKWVITNKP